MDTILASTIAGAKYRHPFHNYYVLGDNNASYQIVAQVEGQLFVESMRLDVLARVVQTGKALDRAGLVRVRIEFARDIGDAEGTLSFGDGEWIGGRANYRLFENQEG